MSQPNYICPHDMMSDDQNHVVKGEVSIRKGMVVAALEKAKIFDDSFIKVTLKRK